MTVERARGIQFVTDEAGNRTAVLISLDEWGELWEDIYDILVSESRRDEPATDWEDLKAELRSEGITFGALPS
jgi:hypothetical protein